MGEKKKIKVGKMTITYDKKLADDLFDFHGLNAEEELARIIEYKMTMEMNIAREKKFKGAPIWPLEEQIKAYEKSLFLQLSPKFRRETLDKIIKLRMKLIHQKHCS